MDFFQSQESLNSFQWILRAVVAYLFLLFVAKLMGQRSISQLNFLDFVIALSIGNIIAHPLSDEKLGFKGSLISTSVLASLYIISVFVSLKSNRVNKFFDTPPMPLIENGNIIYKNLAKARVSIDFILSELRKEKIEDPEKVALAMWEAGGTLSIFLKPQYQNVTREDMNLPSKVFSIPRTVIKEGKIDSSELRESGNTEKWLLKQIQQTYKADIKDILLATVDNKGQVKVFLYKY
ncbi:DUF421 domain-containing protein [Lederbergia citrea]|uniref:DUF421 domain-containing protein n=1 Tax=Lederbergia citrea TaxID=2833581 RepID=A0A942UNI7_9BACI|nr:DUF421 domain-containing protein [Lederbergia citrea]MBS4176794.1 DUF421 domain-containing protein [Lederbergia citrea]MBS4203354.1 DUF421 domain-containing protein [Lederbergia citrea]MBS4221973.1 DUF421 domain-containing protein [Lederbergia citrea]